MEQPLQIKMTRAGVAFVIDTLGKLPVNTGAAPLYEELRVQADEQIALQKYPPKAPEKPTEATTEANAPKVEVEPKP